MLDDKTIQFIEKVAAEGSTGETQQRKKFTSTAKNYPGEGAGLGAILGTAAGAMSKKYRPLAALGGALGGSAIGRAIGKRTIGQTKGYQAEGTAKKQEKRDKPGEAQLPRLNDSKKIKSNE